MITSRALLLTFAIGAVVSVSSCSISRELAERDPDNRPVARELAWDGAETLVVGVPAEVHFVQAPGPGTVLVTGPRRSVRTFSADGGVLDDATFRTGAALKIVVTAPKVTRFVVKGRDKLVIENFEQDELRIEATGWADVKAGGRAGVVHLNLLGSGWADLSQVDARGAEISLTGFRRAIIAPREWAKISGSGDVILTNEPAHLAHDPNSSGRVIHVRPPASTGTAM